MLWNVLFCNKESTYQVGKHKKSKLTFSIFIRKAEATAFLYSTVCISYQDTSCIQSQNQDIFLHRVKLKTDLQAF